MSDKLTVVLNGQAVLDYDRNKPLGETQMAYLQKMDEAMAKGIRIGPELVSSPDLQQKAQFVALELLKGLNAGNDALIAASCSYLANRLPDLQQVVAKTMEGSDNLFCDLVFDRPYVQENSLQFHKPN